MCVFSKPDIPAPQYATETAASKMPDQGTAGVAGNQMKDRMRAASPTILTSNSGVMSPASTAKKTLLGA